MVGILLSFQVEGGTFLLMIYARFVKCQPIPCHPQSPIQSNSSDSLFQCVCRQSFFFRDISLSKKGLFSLIYIRNHDHKKGISFISRNITLLVSWVGRVDEVHWRLKRLNELTRLKRSNDGVG